MFYRSYLHNAKRILLAYTGKEPFSIFLKQFFSKEKQFGSRDRKAIASICFQYFRIVNGLPHSSVDDVLMTSLYLNAQLPIDLFAQYNTEWPAHINESTEQKAAIAGIDMANLFPLNNELSAQIDTIRFNASHLQQPNLFIRIRPGYETIVQQKLLNAALPFHVISNNCVELPNSTKLDGIITMNKEAVIQDYNSQQVNQFFSLMQLPDYANVWDCCAASGGKTIMLSDLVPGVNIIASDIRNTIVYNLQNRIKQAGLSNIKTYCTDSSNIEEVKKKLGPQKFDLVMCDAPCSGSGTWGRTPEQLKNFHQNDIATYTTLQKKIVDTAIKMVKKNGFFLYITCSVFKKENEDIASYIRSNSPVQLKEEKYLTGYNNKADTMYACLLQKSED